VLPHCFRAFCDLAVIPLDRDGGTWHRAFMGIGAPKDLTECRRFFVEPESPKQRQYEALRAYFVENRPSKEVAETFGYSPGAFRVLCHHFRRESDPRFFVYPQKGPDSQPKKSAARQLAIALRKQNHSVYEISDALKERGRKLSPTAVREILREEGFAPLPRRLDEERADCPRPEKQAVADVRAFSIAPRRFLTRCGGLFLFIPSLVRLELDEVAKAGELPGSKMIPREHALRACLALKLWAVERKSHVMSLVTDEGLALFSGLNVSPKKSYLSEYSSQVDPRKIGQLLALWHDQVHGDALFPGTSFNLDFHSVPYYGEDPLIERHYVSARSRRQPRVLVFLVEDADSRAFCYSNADIRKGEERDKILGFVRFWKKTHGQLPAHLVFDSQLTTYANLAKLDKMDIAFITLRRRSPKLLAEIEALPPSAWRRTELDVPTRKYRWPRVYEQQVTLAERTFRQLYVLDLGHDKATILLTNEKRTAAKVLTRYAQRMLVENAISDAVRFFHMDALSSTVGMKIDFDMALLVIASGLYRLLARKMRGYADAKARSIFRDLLDTPADVEIDGQQVLVRFHRRAHLPIVIASGLLDEPVMVPWWHSMTLRMTERLP
jgi:transposase